MNFEQLEEANIKARSMRKKLLFALIPLISIFIFVIISSYSLNWVYENHGFEKLIISCTILLSVITMNNKRC